MRRRFVLAAVLFAVLVALTSTRADAGLVNCRDGGGTGVIVVRPSCSMICSSVCDFANPDGTIVGWFGFGCSECSPGPQGGFPVT